jgi:hypothetical protein
MGFRVVGSGRRGLVLAASALVLVGSIELIEAE